MAFVSIQNGVVDRIIKDKGFVVVENYRTRGGDDKQTKYTVWTDTPNDIPGEGVTVSVSGALSVKLNEFVNDEGETVRFASINVNRPKITLVDLPASAPASARQSQSPVSDWETPF